MTDPNENRNLWATWQKHVEWKDKLSRRASHKALDIPDDEMIYADNSRTGMGWKELLVAGSLLLGAGGIFAGMSGLKGRDVEKTSEKTVETLQQVDPEFDIIFYDESGHEIRIPHINTR